MSASTALFTKEQACAVTRGRKPLLPVEYETAVKSLAACLTIDDSKYWSDMADALAAWAKIYHDEDALRKSKMLKLHAFRRMGEIAGELRPHINNGNRGRLPGPMDLLLKSGLSNNGATAARRLAAIPQKQFHKLLDQPRAPTTVLRDLWNREESWNEFTHAAMSFRSVMRRHTPSAIATVCKHNERFVVTARQLLVDMTEWFDELESRLPKKVI